ncbi:hypothetical protein HBI20_015160 [Parastagonospora nodorum]|nr:hypothetical protein HBI20_015160 [Parastagonospora nodorum]
MAGDAMQAMTMSPIHSTKELGGAAVQWACTRRGRVLLLTVVFFTIVLGLGGVHNREAISSRYHALQWRPYIPYIPAILQAPFKAPSNTTLRLENGDLTVVPPQLKKTTPNFHLVMPAEKDKDAFCRTTLSSMLLNYPPPTVVDLNREFKDNDQRERETLLGIKHYIENSKYVQDEDVVLIVDGENSWFQLPSDAIIKQYARVLEDANARLLKQYGVDKNGFQRYNQSIVFGAEKMCEGEDMACRYAPKSTLPANLYGKTESFDAEDRPARYLNSKMVMGPAKDLKVLYHAALRNLDIHSTREQTVQSVLATMFGEQQLRRDAVVKEETKLPVVAGIKDILEGTKGSELKVDLATAPQYEFSMGLDYAHTLFQPLAYAHEDELVALVHRNDTDISDHLHSTSWTKSLDLPRALNESNPPFWRPDLNSKNNPSPNERPAHIDNLDLKPDLDNLPTRTTPWTNLRLVQNTYTGSVPAILLAAANPAAANVTWKDMWYYPYKRALLRNYFRTPQSPLGYHNSLVGGDRSWDMRGGRGGVWTATDETWLAWGEADGVCGSVNQIKEVFNDGKGVWLHEGEAGAEDRRLEEERRVSGEIDKNGFKTDKGGKMEAVEKDEEEEKKKKAEEEAKEKQEEEAKEKQEEEAKKKAEEEAKKKAEDEERERQRVQNEKEQKEMEEKQKQEQQSSALAAHEDERERQRAKAEQDMKDMEALDRAVIEGME